MIQMSLSLRSALILGAVLTAAVMLKRIRKQTVQIEHAMFWLLFSLLLVVLACCPFVIYLIAKPLGIISPANLVFAIIILILIVKMFQMTLEMSRMETKISELAQHIAIREARDREAAGAAAPADPYSDMQKSRILAGDQKDRGMNPEGCEMNQKGHGINPEGCEKRAGFESMDCPCQR